MSNNHSGKVFYFLPHNIAGGFCVFWSIVFFLLLSGTVNAATYTLTSGSYPPCNTSWNVSGTTYTCTGNGGKVTLATGDILASNKAITISANNGFVLSNNTVGSATNIINLVATSGTITSGNTNTVYGSITNTGSINLIGTTVSGTITSSADITLTGSSVAGLVTSTSSTITTSGTSLSGGAKADSGLTMSGGTLSGTVVMTDANAAVSLTNVSMASGSISGASTILVAGSTIGSSSSPVPMSSNSGAITVQGSSVVYGNLTAPNSSTVNVSGSSVYGTCLPSSTPANACSSASAPVCTTGLIGGLLGSYFANRTLTGSATASRTDSTVNFDWGNGTPGVSGIAANNFSVRWTGSLRAPKTGNYKFQTVSDDGVRLYINNALVIDNWNDHGSTIDTSAIVTLTAGQSYPVRLEFYENGGDAAVKLSWIVPGSSTALAISTQLVLIPIQIHFVLSPPRVRVA